ncbi:MAG TPA: MAC/perforin domain-containing protein, partial [Ktedonobacteraceae bacterium]|nr:MAC/perforin domain-containing protein [Ktedonobacteraceae bacterium]
MTGIQVETCERKQTMVDLIPGYDYIGRGFDVFGTFDVRSLAQKQRLFNTSTPSEQTYTLGERAYTVPENTAVLEVKSQGGQTVFFSQKSDVSEFFSAQAGIEGNYLAFSGAFEAAFGSIAKSVSEYQFGMFYLTTDGFAVEVVEANEANLLPSVKADPDFANLPMEYTTDNEYLFFRFFAKYGTHFVRSVNLGGRLLYSVAIDKSYQFSQQDFETRLNAEYQATFGASANAQVEWKRVGEVWADHRKVMIDAVGGDTSLLNGLKQSEPPDNFNQYFESWLASLATAYGATNFALTGVDKLFSGTQADAVRQAMLAYTQEHLFLQAQGGHLQNQTGGSLILGGSALVEPDFSGGGLSVAVLDRTSLEPLFAADYSLSWQGQFGHADYTRVEQDLAEFEGNSSLIVALLFWGQYSIWGYPSQKLRNFLYSCGAGAGLDRWGDFSTSTSFESCCYTIVGVPGWTHDQALEVYVGGGSP